MNDYTVHKGWLMDVEMQLVLILELCIHHWLRKPLVLHASGHKRTWKSWSWMIHTYVHRCLIQLFFFPLRALDTCVCLNFRSEWLAFLIWWEGTKASPISLYFVSCPTSAASLTMDCRKDFPGHHQLWLSPYVQMTKT